MKKLNRKGFTLIELLAVIVIMAIIVVVTVPTIINSISDARVSSIWNLSKSVANSYDSLAAQDMLSSTKVLSGHEATKEWSCISPSLAFILELSDNDVCIKEDDISAMAGFDGGETPIQLVEANITGDDTCSAIRLRDNGSAEVLLVARTGGKFNVSGKTVYGLSTAANGVIKEENKLNQS